MAEMGSPAPLIGGGILNLVTSGTYDNPLAVYREYIQNAADAVGLCRGEEAGRVEIEIDTLGMRVRVRDNGPGLSEKDVPRALLPLHVARNDGGPIAVFAG